MNARIDITGINTSELPRLTHDEQIDLLLKSRNGDDEAREKFLMGNIRLVLSVARRFASKKENLDDVFQVGVIGLIKAMKNFNTAYNLRFSTYAVPMIIGEIRRFLRDSSPLKVSRSLRDTAYKALQMRQELEKNCDEEVTLDEVAAALNIPVFDIIEALDAIGDPVSIYDPIYHDDGETLLVMDQIADEKNTAAKHIDYLSVREAARSLSDRESRILRLRFYEGKTQVEVSEEIGISQAQVSRLEKTALKFLKSHSE